MTSSRLYCMDSVGGELMRLLGWLCLLLMSNGLADPALVFHQNILTRSVCYPK